MYIVRMDPPNNFLLEATQNVRPQLIIFSMVGYITKSCTLYTENDIWIDISLYPHGTEISPK